MQRLTAVFQPILDLNGIAYSGFEGLIRGPAHSFLESPAALFAVARHHELLPELEHACRQTICRSFAQLRLPGLLFINTSPRGLHDPRFVGKSMQEFLHQLGLTPNRIVLEITENEQITHYPMIRGLLKEYRDQGYRVAIDDLGEGFSNLRMWSEVTPEFIKIDRHFVSGIASDALKFQFVRAMQQLAESCNAQIIAEGIESDSDLVTIRDLGITYGQGYLISLPASQPRSQPCAAIANLLARQRLLVFPSHKSSGAGLTVQTLARPVPPVSPQTPNSVVYQRFEADPELLAIPVVEQHTPLGLISRTAMIDRFARPFRRELYGRKACSLNMDTLPLLLDRHTTVQEAGLIISRAASRHLAEGFIVTDQGRYVGLGSGHDLMAAITEMQIRAARYANPLTHLPGNVPINEHIDRLIGAGTPFAACYFDIDHFKPFNDAYGYRRGDDMILLLGQIIRQVAAPEIDFVGHIGGDDFICLFQSGDWENRCNEALELFAKGIAAMFKADDREREGYLGENRKGEPVLHPLPSLSIGALFALPGCFESHRDIAAAAADAKCQAKKCAGNSLFIERRSLGHKPPKSPTDAAADAA